jgi:hypothetical protein
VATSLSFPLDQKKRNQRFLFLLIARAASGASRLSRPPREQAARAPSESPRQRAPNRDFLQPAHTASCPPSRSAQQRPPPCI